jgi:hypothetical protein
MPKDRTPEDVQREVAEDARRTVGYMDSVVTRARRADVSVPGGVTACVDVWRGWVRSMDRAGEDR